MRMNPTAPQPDSFWAALADEERAAVASIARLRTFAPGDFLCREGDRSRQVYVLMSGHVRVETSGSTERGVVVAVRGPGDVLGELAALDSAPRAATLCAIDTVEALIVPGEPFARLCQTRARLSWVLLGVVASRVRDTGRRWVEFGGGTATRRVAALLLDIALKQGQWRGSDLVVRNGPTQQELAAMTTLSRESIARVLSGLREHGTVSTSRRQFTIHEMAELRKLAR
jgi:CRP/FNR family cyclic AMP-dependent transcriptional regulator